MTQDDFPRTGSCHRVPLSRKSYSHLLVYISPLDGASHHKVAMSPCCDRFCRSCHLVPTCQALSFQGEDVSPGVRERMEEERSCSASSVFAFPAAWCKPKSSRGQSPCVRSRHAPRPRTDARGFEQKRCFFLLRRSSNVVSGGVRRTGVGCVLCKPSQSGGAAVTKFQRRGDLGLSAASSPLWRPGGPIGAPAGLADDVFLCLTRRKGLGVQGRGWSPL